jgi:hypothetical protein
VAAAGNRELAGDGGEDDFDFIAQPDQHRDGDDGNKSEDQGVLDESLAFPPLPPATADYLFVIHDLIISFCE